MWNEDQRIRMDAARRALDALTDEDRLEVLSLYCNGCGCKQDWHPSINNPRPMGCQCQNDE